MESVWSESTVLPKFNTMKKNTTTDILIIGGGMAGILCAYQLDRAGADYILIEADTIGNGITKNTTAKITAQHGLVYQHFIQTKGLDKARDYLQINEQALAEYRRLCKSIDCDFEEQDAFVYSLDNAASIEREVQALQKLNIPAEYVSAPQLPFPTAGAVKFPNQAQFHPLKFLRAISAGLNIYEHTAARELSEHKAITDGGIITANKIIVATHFPFLNKHGFYFVKMYQDRSYVIGLEHAVPVPGMYIDEASHGISLRNYNDLLLVGGGGHRTGKTGGGFEELSAFADRYYPTAKIKYRWVTQDCMTLDQVPYIGQYAGGTPALFVAAGFNKWGMTSSMAAAMILTDLVAGKKNPYAEVFSPSRNMLTPQLIKNAAASTYHLLTPTTPRCPHLGCALKWNAAEHTWDCPCHGSRFEKDGQLIDNPATGNLKMK